MLRRRWVRGRVAEETAASLLWFYHLQDTGFGSLEPLRPFPSLASASLFAVQPTALELLIPLPSAGGLPPSRHLPFRVTLTKSAKSKFTEAFSDMCSCQQAPPPGPSSKKTQGEPLCFQVNKHGRQPAFLLSYVDSSFPTQGLTAAPPDGHYEQETVW